MNDAQRNKFLTKYRVESPDPNVIAAVVERVPELSGITPLVHENLMATLISEQFPAELSDIADTLDALDAAEQAIEGGRAEARKQSGISFNEYEGILREVETQVDEKFAAQPNTNPKIASDEETAAMREGLGKLTLKQRHELIDFAINMQADSLKGAA